MMGQFHIFTVIDGAVDDDWFILLEGFDERRQQVFRLFDAVADGPHAFGKFHEIRIGEIDVFVMGRTACPASI